MIYDKNSFNPESEEYTGIHEKIIDALPIPIFYRDTEGIYRLSNKAHQKFTKKSKAEIIGKSVHDIHTRETAENYSRQDKELLNNPGEQVFEMQIKRHSGKPLHVILNKAVIRDANGEITGIVGSIIDITELKKTQERLLQAQKSMEVSSHMLHKISAGIAMINSDYKVIDSNESFARLMGDEISDLYETIPGLIGADVKGLVPDVIFKMLMSIMQSGEESLARDLRYMNKLIHVTVRTLYKNKIVGVVIRDMSAPMLVQDEIINRAQRINRQNIRTVQKIAQLLGENAAETEELLNSIIETHRYGDES